MRRLFITLLFFCLCINLPAQNDYHFISSIEQKNAQHASRTTHHTSSLNNTDLIYQRCEWQVDPAVLFITGKITSYFTPNTSISQLEFDLSDSLTIDSVIYHSGIITFTHTSEILTAVFPSSLPASSVDSIAVYYHGAPPSTGFGSFDTATHMGVPVMWTLSQPDGASDWWPCKQNLADKIDSVDIIVTCPSAYRAASNGLLVNEYISGPNRIAVWKHRYPISTYLICFAVSNYAVFSNIVTFGPSVVPVLNYVYPEDSAFAALATNDIILQMQLYDTLFGPYPFTTEKYGHTECNFGGGMEHQTMTFVGGFSYELMSHELAHHWFGDKVTCSSWHDIWLNEGFASYLSGLCYEHYTPNQYWLPFKQGRISYVTSQPGGTVYNPDTINVSRMFDDRLTYAKGAMILHTLRWVIGDSAWYAAVNNYLNDASCSYGFATTTDLKQHFETSSGQNLTWYFDDWFTGAGFPSYTISWDEDSNNLATFTVTQTQSDTSVNFFELPLPIEFKDATHDTIVRVQHTFSGQPFSVQLSFHADSLIFDPEYWIISANNVVNNVPAPTLNSYMNIYPNPASDQLLIHSGNAFSGKGSLKIYDATGRLVLSNTLSFHGTDETQSLFVDQLDQGMYVIVIETENGSTTDLFIKK